MAPTDSVVEREFDALARTYEDNRLAAWYQAHSDIVLTHCPQTIPGDVLDIGCGSGYFLRQLKSRHPGVKALGIDISAGMIEIAEAKRDQCGIQDLRFLQGDWENLGQAARAVLDEYRFGLVVCANAFHYFLQPEGSLRSMHRTLDTGGVVLLLEREESNSPMTRLWGLLHRYFIKDQVKFYRGDQLAKLLKASGFGRVAIKETLSRYLWKGKFYTSIALLEGRKSP